MPANNYIKVVFKAHVVELFCFDDTDGFSAHIAFNRAKVIQRDLLHSVPQEERNSSAAPRLIVWRIPEQARDDELYQGCHSTQPCPSWAHDWQRCGRTGWLCSRCGEYDQEGKKAHSQAMDEATDQALQELNRTS